MDEKPFEVGETFGADWCFSDQQVSDFATLAGDFNPIHHDIKQAQAMGFDEIVISGTQYTAMMMGLVATFVSNRCPTLGLEFDFKYKKAIFANQRLKVIWKISAIQYHPKLQGDMIYFEGQLLNDKDELCTLGKGMLLRKDNA